jgi:protein disulfide-isomerase
MKKIILTALVCLVAVWANAAGLQWMTEFNQAQAKAKAENKLLFLNFTGSDWCILGKKLDSDIFSKPEFIQYAQKNLVMVYVDFPRKALEPAQKAANEALKAKYGVRGYPTLVVLNAKGEKVYEKTGYMDGVDKWIADLDEAKKK